MAKLPVELVLHYMERIALVVNGKPISKAKFAQMADIHTYGRSRNGLKVLYFGLKDNKFAFYPPQTNKKESIDIAYGYYLDCFTDMKQEYLDGNVCWGNCGIPLSYGDLRVWEHTIFEK
jgi:hypothetical protein